MRKSRNSRSRVTTRQLGIGAILTALALGLQSGCTREFYREWANQDVSEAVFEKSRDPRWRMDIFSVEPPALSPVCGSLRSGSAAGASRRSGRRSPFTGSAVARQPSIDTGRGNRLPRPPRILEAGRDSEEASRRREDPGGRARSSGRDPITAGTPITDPRQPGMPGQPLSSPAGPPVPPETSSPFSRRVRPSPPSRRQAARRACAAPPGCPQALGPAGRLTAGPGWRRRLANDRGRPPVIRSARMVGQSGDFRATTRRETVRSTKPWRNSRRQRILGQTHTI